MVSQPCFIANVFSFPTIHFFKVFISECTLEIFSAAATIFFPSDLKKGNSLRILNDARDYLSYLYKETSSPKDLHIYKISLRQDYFSCGSEYHDVNKSFFLLALRSKRNINQISFINRLPLLTNFYGCLPRYYPLCHELL